MNITRSTRLFATICAGLFASAAFAAPAEPPPLSPLPNYSVLADLALAAPVVAVVTVRDAVKLRDADAAGVAPGRVRFYVTGDVTALVAGSGGLPARIDWIADFPLDSANRAPKLKKRRFLILARAVAGGRATLQLVSKDAMIDWSADAEARVRAILTEKVAPGAAPQITGVGNAFHVAGSIPGEGETQIFLKTADGRPVSLGILRRPGEEPRWSVALGEMVDDAAAAPKRDTLLWYRLACGLPATLPAESVADQSPEDAAQARDDYQLVIAGLGSCGREPSR